MHSPERICEALAWLYGVEFKARQGLKMLGFHTEYMPSSDIFSNQRVTFLQRIDGTFRACWPYNRREDITDRVAHALAVTAPWEWDGMYFERRLEDEEQTLLVAACLTEHKMGAKTFFKWRIASDDGPNIEMHEDTEDAAKTAARAAYLTWMRGLFALKGLPNG